MENEWYYTPSGSETVGPISFEDLRRAVLDQIVQPATAVWTRRMGGEWQRADAVPELRKVWDELDVVRARSLHRLAFNRLSVLESMKQSFAKTKEALYKPFIFLRWVSIAFCTWMASVTALIGFADKESLKSASETNQSAIELLASANIAGLKQFFIPHVSIQWVITIFLYCLLVTYVCVKGRLLFLAKAYQPALALSHCWHNSIRRSRTLLLFYTFISVVLNFAIATCLFHFCLDCGYFSGNVFSLAELRSNPGMLFSRHLVTGVVIFLLLSFVRSFTFHFVEPLVYSFGVPVLTGFKVSLMILRKDPLRYLGYYLFVAVYRIVYAALVVLSLAVVSLLLSLAGLPSTIILSGAPLALVVAIGKLVFLPLDYFYRVMGTRFNH